MKPYNLKRNIVNKLREVYRSYPVRNQALKAALRPNSAYECAECKNLFTKNQVQVDHREPVVSTDGFIDWNTYIERMFCPLEGMWVLCKPCHLKKSIVENAARRRKKAA